ncbi:MAG TPA: SMI1/KNR4 family protein [Polyangiales bacterium]|nr:SMI1/KNR4 family protein [Polyangiales bacterium]
MHRGVHEFIAWIEQHPDVAGVIKNAPAAATDIGLIEERIASPLPADLKLMLTRHNGGPLPSGALLHVGVEGPDSVLTVLGLLAARLEKPVRDPELLFPFYRTDDGGILAFDRSAGPVSDTWPIIDYYMESGEQRLVHRTFDGFCRLRVAEWTSSDFGAEFTLDSYLRSGERHVAIEPDVSIAHATVAHALRRAGRPEDALQAYLRAARCVPAQPWCDWEALKISALLGDSRSGLEAAARVSARAPRGRWGQRETSPTQVADVLAVLAPRLVPRREQLLRIYDQLAEQSDSDKDKQHIVAVRKALFADEEPPTPASPRISSIPPAGDQAQWMAALKKAYQQGAVREEDLLLDPAYTSARKRFILAEVLRVRRGF